MNNMGEEEKQDKQEEAIDWEKKANEYLDGWKRSKADYINREKTIAQEKSALREIVEEAVILEVLPVLDNLKQAISCANGEEKKTGWCKGVEHVIKQFEDILNNFGVQKIDLLGKEFNPAFAEAVEKQGEGNEIIKVVLDGYKKEERVIRAGRVIIG